jgi:uncharacterized membrane protein
MAERAIAQFVGRFHPLSVHLPIAVLFLVPLFELSWQEPPFFLFASSSGLLVRRDLRSDFRGTA